MSLPAAEINPSEAENLVQNSSDGSFLCIFADVLFCGVVLTLTYPWVEKTLKRVDAQFVRQLWLFVQVLLALTVVTLGLLLLTAHQLRTTFCTCILPFVGPAVNRTVPIGMLLKIFLVAFLCLNFFCVSTLQKLLIYVVERMYPFNGNNTVVRHLSAIHFKGQFRAASRPPPQLPRSILDSNRSYASGHSLSPLNEESHNAGQEMSEWQEADNLSTPSSSSMSDQNQLGNLSLLDQRETSVPAERPSTVLQGPPNLQRHPSPAGSAGSAGSARAGSVVIRYQDQGSQTQEGWSSRENSESTRPSASVSVTTPHNPGSFQPKICPETASIPRTRLVRVSVSQGTQASNEPSSSGSELMININREVSEDATPQHARPRRLPARNILPPPLPKMTRSGKRF